MCGVACGGSHWRGECVVKEEAVWVDSGHTRIAYEVMTADPG